MLRIALIAAALAACGRPPARRADPPPAPPAGAPGIAAIPLACPVDVPGTSLAVEDTDDGAAMVFVTTTDPHDLRIQVFAIAGRHNDVFAVRAGPSPGADDDDEIHASAPRRQPPPRLAARPGERDVIVLLPSAARVESIPGGARLVFAAEPAEHAPLRAEVRVEAAAIEDACGWPE